MSLSVYPVFEPKLAGIAYVALGETLVHNCEALDKVARAAKLSSFTVFMDNRPIPPGFDGDPEDLAEAMGEWTEWFNPAEGQAAMQALADHIKANPKAAMRLYWANDVIADLEELARALGAAAAQGVRFRLEFS